MKIVTFTGMMMAVFVTLLGAGCASTTRITGEVKNPEAKAVGAYQKVFLAATLKNNDARIAMENAFQSALAVRGVTGVVSHPIIPVPSEADRELVVNAVKSAGADSMLVINVTKRETETQVSTFTPTQTDTDNFAIYNASAFRADPVVYEYEVIDLEAKLFDAATGKLVWSVRTESIDPKNLQKEITNYATLICNRLVSVGMFGSAKP